MNAPPVPGDELARLAELDRTGLLYSPSEERFDRVTRLARRLFDVPIALVSLVARDSQWFKSVQGLDARETPREVSFCGHAILQDEAFIVRDAAADPKFADNPLVTGAPNIRFYAGQPLRSSGRKVGTLCVIDQRPRDFSLADLDSLRSLGAWVERELEFGDLSASQLELLRRLSAEERAELLDPVTGTWNRRGFEAVMQHQAERPTSDGRPCAALWIGLRSFDGNAAEAATTIASAARRVRTCLRPQDTLAVLGGGVFAVFLGDCGPRTPVIVAERVAESFGTDAREPGDTDAQARVCIGVARAKRFTPLAQKTLFARAQEALTSALEREPGTVIVASASERPRA